MTPQEREGPTRGSGDQDGPDVAVGPAAQDPHALPFEVVRLVAQPKGPGKGETEVGARARQLVGHGLPEAALPVRELQLHRHQFPAQADDVRNPVADGDFVVDLQPASPEETGRRFPEGLLAHVGAEPAPGT